MKTKTRHRIASRRASHLAAPLAAAAAAVLFTGVAKADITFLNKFAQSTTTFIPFYLGSGENGQVVVTDFIDAQASAYAPDGTFLVNFVKPVTNPDSLNGLESPDGAAVGPDGNYYVADSYRNAVEVYAPSGIEQAQLINSTSLFDIAGLAISPTSNMYIVAGPAANPYSTIDVYKTSGQFVTSFAGPGSGPRLSTSPPALPSIPPALMSMSPTPITTASKSFPPPAPWKTPSPPPAKPR